MTDLKRGEKIMDSMLLEQFRGKPNIRAYFMCYFEELNTCFADSEDSYYGRFLETAEGEALDIIGIILDQKRDVVIVNDYFGFQGAVGALGFGAGTFKDENSLGFSVTPLTDAVYRNLLRAKAYVMNKDQCNVEDVYNIVRTVLNRAVPTLSVTYPGDRQFQLNLSVNEVTTAEHALINYASKWFVTNGITFTISRI